MKTKNKKLKWYEQIQVGALCVGVLAYTAICQGTKVISGR